MNPIFSEFKRKFSLSVCKDRIIKLGEMSFSKDFVNDTRGDLYPLFEKGGECCEKVESHLYKVTRGYAERLFCRFFPFASYEVSFVGGEAGFCFRLPDAEAKITVKDGRATYLCDGRREEAELPKPLSEEITLVVSCRTGAFDLYLKRAGKCEILYTVAEPRFDDSNLEAVFSNSYVYLYAAEGATVKSVLSYMDCGISIADIRPIKYENGEPMFEGGRVYLTASVRMNANSYQGIFSWIPGTAELDMTGALFFNTGEGRWSNFVASCIVYDRGEKRWYAWASSFGLGHILVRCAFDGDVRWGVNVLDVEFMERANEKSSITDFVGFEGDEDPDIIYDSKNDRWLMAVCRVDPELDYGYMFYESKSPLDGYTYLGRTPAGGETGGSFVSLDGEIFFVCGVGWETKSGYRIFDKNGYRTASFNYPDGGFRGWGTVIPVKLGNRTRTFWLTFDRHRGSEYNWSYGNLYCFEAQRQ